MFLKASCSMRFRLGSLWEALKSRRPRRRFRENWDSARNKTKQKKELCLPKILWPQHFLFFIPEQKQNKEAGREPANRLLSLSVRLFPILNANKIMQRCSNLLFFLINK